MLARDVQVSGFEREDWRELRSLLLGPRFFAQRRGVVALVDGERLLRVLTSDGLSIAPAETEWPEPLGTLAQRHHVDWALRLQFDCTQQLLEQLGAGIERHHSLLDQGLLLLRAMRQLQEQGAYELWPTPFPNFPIPSKSAVESALNLAAKPGEVIALGGFQNGRLVAALAARRGLEGFDRLVGPQLLQVEMGLVSGDWVRDYRYLVAAIEREVGPVGVACFGELSTLRQLFPVARPGMWTSAVAARDVIFYPAAPGTILPLGYDLGRATLKAARSLFERLGQVTALAPDGPLEPLYQQLRESTRGLPSLEEVLGFSPAAVIRSWLDDTSQRQDRN